MQFAGLVNTCTMDEVSFAYDSRVTDIPAKHKECVLLCNTLFNKSRHVKLKKMGFKEVAKYKGSDGIVHVMLYIPPIRRIRKRRRVV